jgi:mono/diheme cytochrome c family protein
MKGVVTILLSTAALYGCQSGDMTPADLSPPPWASGMAIASDPQRSGDPQKGYDALVNDGYVRCGIPWSIYSRFFGAASTADQLPGRTGRNATLPFAQTSFTTDSGVEVVSANCLTCHAGHINGKLVVGLGNTEQDYTTDPSSEASTAKSIAPMITQNAAELAEIDKWATRVETIGPYTTLGTVGVNPGDNLAAILLSHRDPTTLAWSDMPLLQTPPMIGVPVDVPPWWRMAKKNSMFYVDAGHGDHARIEMAAANLCTDSVAEAQMIDAWFPDIEAYIASIQPPAWPFDVDAALAGRGRDVFIASCSGCHGRYDGADGEYPNLWIPLDTIQTDPVLAVGSSQFAQRFLDWWAKSFYGAVSQLVPKQGYVAPPLDGVWATAPYLHNGSVPTLAALLDSTTRPTYWSRTFDSTDYDQAALGWHFTTVDHGQAAEPDATTRSHIYDTTQLGYGNGGHTFGDALTTDERAAVLEYLKTL